MWPFTYSGVVTTDVEFTPRARNRLESVLAAELYRLRASNIEAGDGKVTFTVKFYQPMGSWYATAGPDGGRLEITQREGRLTVEFHLGYRCMFIGAVAISALIGLVAVDTPFPVLRFCLLGGFYFSLLFFMNQVLSISRFERFIRRCIEQAQTRLFGENAALFRDR